MIAPLRKRHRLMFSVLAPIVLGLLFLALSQRAPTSISTSLPDALKASTFQNLPNATSENLGEGFFADPAVSARLVRSDSTLGLELTPQAAVRPPHVLVYWRPEGAGDGVASAHLLGQLVDGGAQTFPLPPRASGGDVVLYSLAHQKVLANSALGEVEWPVAEPEATDWVDEGAEAAPTNEEGAAS